jgi:hypothetical protein
MSQVGHADLKMTLDVYAQLEQRVKREHGVRFDALVREARAQFYGAEVGPETATKRRRTPNQADKTLRDR